jgi:AP-1 complex subunit mu
MISSLYILDTKGKVILSRCYREEVSSRHADAFMRSILEDEDELLGPIFEVDGVTHIHVKHNNLYCKSTLIAFNNISTISYREYTDSILIL